MYVIWKYRLGPTKGEYVVSDVPCGAEVLSLQIQDGLLTFWMLVDPKNLIMKRKFVVVETGEELKSAIGDLRFVGTVQFSNGYVLHVFDIGCV